MYNIAVILAGGIGTRVGGATPKQLLPLADGRSILEHSVEAFERAACIDEIGIVMHKDYLAQAQDMVRRNGWQKVAWVIAGGNERWESSVNAICKIEQQINKINSGTDEQGNAKESRPVINILLHDAARPFVSERIITDVCTALQHHEAVTVAIPATDTMYIVKKQEIPEPLPNQLSTNRPSSPQKAPDNQNAPHNQVVQDIPPRSTLLCAQTPQAFRLTTIAEAYRLATAETYRFALPVPNQLPATALSGCPHLPATDDCGIVHRYLPHIPIHIVLGDSANRKITYKEDL